MSSTPLKSLERTSSEYLLRNMRKLFSLSEEFFQGKFVLTWNFLSTFLFRVVFRPILLEWAKIQIRSRFVLIPMESPPNTPHLASNPILAKSPRTRPSPLEVSIGEFSTNTNLGCTSQMILAISRHIPLRSPSMPAPPPAAEMSWHGKPPDTTSTIPRHGFPSKV